MIKTGLKGFLETEVIPIDKIGSVETDMNLLVQTRTLKISCIR
jgi:hypothetical protein